MRIENKAGCIRCFRQRNKKELQFTGKKVIMIDKTGNTETEKYRENLL